MASSFRSTLKIGAAALSAAFLLGATPALAQSDTS